MDCRTWTGEAFYSGGRYEALGSGDSLTFPFTIASPPAATTSTWPIFARRSTRTPARSSRLSGSPPPRQSTATPAIGRRHHRSSIGSVEQILRGDVELAGPGAGEHGASPRLGCGEPVCLRQCARSRAPDSRGVGPDVWRGDAVWLYLDTTGQRSRIDVKLTLAQTPSGPQVWDWVGQGGSCPAPRSPGAKSRAAIATRSRCPGTSLNRRNAGAGARARVRGRHRVRRRLHRLDGDRSRHPIEPRAADACRDAGRGARRLSGTRSSTGGGRGLRVELDGQPVATLPERISPDRDYLWLDHDRRPARAEHRRARDPPHVRGPGLRRRERRRRVLADPATASSGPGCSADGSPGRRSRFDPSSGRLRVVAVMWREPLEAVRGRPELGVVTHGTH